LPRYHRGARQSLEEFFDVKRNNRSRRLLAGGVGASGGQEPSAPSP
jgi:hypothetical protein